MSGRSSVVGRHPSSQALCVSKKLHQYGCKEVAQELALMDAEMLRKIAPEELENGAWMKKDKKYQLAPNVMAMVGSFNCLALLVPTEILEEKTAHARAKIVTSFIQIASKCYRLHNYNSLKAVLAGLQCTPIFRLKKTWKEVPSKRKKRFNQLTALMSEEQNWTAYRNEIKQKVDSNLPCIPFLGVFLTTVALSQEADNLVEDKGMERRRASSFYEAYHILEAITVRNKLNRLRSQASRQFEEDPDILSPSPPPNPHSDSDNEENDKGCPSSSSSSVSTLHQTNSSSSMTTTSPGDSSIILPHSVSQTTLPSSTAGKSTSAQVLNGTSTPSKPHTRPTLNHARPVSESDDYNGSRHEQRSVLRPSSADAIRRDPPTSLLSTQRRNSGSGHRGSLATTSRQLSTSRSSTKRPPLVREATLSGSLECLLDAVNTSNDDIGWERALTKSTSLHSIDAVEIESRHSDSDIELGDISLDTVDPEDTLTPTHVQQRKEVTGNTLQTKHTSLQNVFDRKNDHSFVHSNGDHTPHNHSNGYHDDSIVHNTSNTPVSVTHKNSHKMTNLKALPINGQPSTSTVQTTPEHKSSELLNSPNMLLSLPPLHPRKPSFSPRVGHFLKHTISVPSINFHRDRRMTPDVPKMRILQLDKPSKPIDVLQQFQFLSLGCSSGSECLLEVRQLLMEGRHNSEALNYKLSYEREPN